MSPIEEKAQQDKLQAEELVAAVPLMDEVQRIDVELYTDNTGDPAFQLLFYVKPDVEIDRQFIRRFNEYAGTVQTRILHSDINRFPHARLKRAA